MRGEGGRDVMHRDRRRAVAHGSLGGGEPLSLSFRSVSDAPVLILSVFCNVPRWVCALGESRRPARFSDARGGERRSSSEI
jgi:hypothetical protein